MKTLNFLPLLFFISITSLAQDIIENIDGVGKIQKNSKKEISYFQSIGKEKVFTDHSDFFRNVLNISKNDEFRLLNEGKSFNKYHQYFNGVPVKNGVFALHINNGIIKSANGNYVRIGELNTNPAISKVRAMERWCNYLNVPIKDVSHFKSELFVIDLNEYNESASHSRPVLAYRTRVYSKHPSNTLIGFIDAHSENICLTEPLALASSNTAPNPLMNVNPLPSVAPLPPPATGTFSTRYCGTQTAITESRNNLFFLEDWTRGDGIELLNLENTNAADTTGAGSFSDDDNNWTAVEFDNEDNDNAALDTQWALQEVYDYFEDVHSRSGWDNDGQKINAYVHAVINGSRDNAAYYEGEYLAFGDGLSTFFPLVSLDAVAHEYAHGINDHTSEFGALGVVRSFNEGLSDIWAAIIENYLAPQKSHWEIGEEIMRNADCLRNISNPNDPNADTEIANTFGTSEYNSNTNVYYRSGILSHWFYWLSVGGSGINGLGNEYNVYGIGIEAAADLIYHAQSEGFLIGTTSYSLMRTNIVNAADDLYGENSIQSLQVENAWYAMGVGTYPGQAEISGPSITCSSGASYSISNLPPEATITWSTGTPITRVSSQGSNPCTFKSLGSGEGWIQATIDTGCGAITLPRKTVWGGIVLPLDLKLRDRFTGMFKWELCKSEANPVNADHTGGEAHIDDWGWDVSGGYITYDNPYDDNSMATLRPLSTSFTVELRAHNACGWSEWVDMGVSVIYCGGWYMTMYPNPANDVVTLSFETADEIKTTEGKTHLESKGEQEKTLNAYSIQIWSEKKGMVRSLQSDEKEIQIPLHGLEKGKYYLHLIYNDKTYKEVLFVE